MSSTVRSGVAALALTVPVLAEVTQPELFDATWAHLLFAASQLLGWALLASVVLACPAPARAASPRGRRLILAACALQMGFAAVYAATALDGEPLEASFVLFLLGFLAQLAGGLLWASRLRRAPGAGLAAAGLLGVAVLGALAILIGTDPFHDIFLVSSYAAWFAVGHGLDRIAGAGSGSNSERANNSAAPVIS